ncbi:MAG: ABC transporter permease, partial [Spirochaetaceae bacterium]
MIATIVVAFSLMLLGNAVLSYTRDTLYSVFAGTVAGDMSVSASPEDSQFTLFGSDALLVGDLLVPPTIVDFPGLNEFVVSHPDVAHASPAISALARVEVQNRRSNRTVLGVDFDRHWSAFPDIELISGRFPESGERGILVQEGWGDATEDLIGVPAVLSVARDLTFTIREVPVVGVFRFPIDDELLNRIVITDPETARSLNGYVFGTGGELTIPDADRDALDQDLDDLFGGDDLSDEEGSDTEEPEDRDLFADLDAFFDQTSEDDVADRATVEGAWNFLLIRLADPSRRSAVQRDLQNAGFGRDDGYQIRDWRGTVGGPAQFVWFLQILFNAGIVFVALGAALVTTNALVLSVLERTHEIGAMRALGATRMLVSRMVFIETTIVVMGSAIIGVGLGYLLIIVLNAMNYVSANQYLAILFGGRAVQGSITLASLALHLFAGLVLVVISVLYP